MFSTKGRPFQVICLWGHRENYDSPLNTLVSKDLNVFLLSWSSRKVMTSSNANFQRYWSFVRGFHRSPISPLTKASELWCLLWSAPEPTVVQTIESSEIWDAIASIMSSLYWNIDKTFHMRIRHSKLLEVSIVSILENNNRITTNNITISTLVFIDHPPYLGHTLRGRTEWGLNDAAGVHTGTYNRRRKSMS